jgi:hypothetical protein
MNEPECRPSFAPPILALGLMLLAWGVVTSWMVSVLGLILLGYASSLWLRDS